MRTNSNNPENQSHIMYVMTYLYAQFIIWNVVSPIGGDIRKLFDKIPGPEKEKVMEDIFEETGPLINNACMQISEDVRKTIKKAAGIA